jgi:hypothetical protein
MRRKLWIVSMGLIALLAATESNALAGSCRAPASSCQSGNDCCSHVCTCREGALCECD